MRRNQYAGILEPWKVRLILNRARRRGYRGADLDEVVQRIAIEMLDFRFDPDRSNGAAETTVITALVDRQLAFYWRGESRYRGHVDKATLKTEPTVDYRESFDETMDVLQAVAELPEFSQRVCTALGNGLSIQETARQLGVSWHTVEKQVRLIRRHFQRLGLGSTKPTSEVEAA